MDAYARARLALLGGCQRAFAKSSHCGPETRCDAVWVNGYHVTDWVDAREAHENPRKGLRTAAGTIILQGHDPTTDLLFSNLRISPLQQRPTADSL